MSTQRTEVRVSDQDPEMLALKAVATALAPLDRDTAARVLGWAEARYGIEAQRTAHVQLNKDLMFSLEKTAQTLGVVADASRQLHMDPGHLRTALNRLYDEAVAEAENVTSGAR
jgi:hypothetical protein